MKRLFVIVAVLVGCCGSVWGFDVSPTQVNKKPDNTGPVHVSSRLMDAVLSDQKLADGIELLAVTSDGKRLDSMCGSLSDPLQGDFAAATRMFINNHSPLFNLPVVKDDSFLKLVDVKKCDAGQNFTYQMILGGVIVHDAVIQINVGKNNVIDLVNGSFPTIAEIANQISLSSNQAIAAARNSLNMTNFRTTPYSELRILPLEDMGLMVYVVDISAVDPLGDWRFIINADTGKEIARTNEMAFAQSSGKGSVYVTHPLSSNVTVEPLVNLNTHGLVGLYANVVNEDTQGSVSDDDTHIYEPENTHFDEVMIYYQINKIHDFFKAMGYSKLDRPMKAVVHYGTAYDNAYFSPWENAISFGDGKKFNDLSKEETICYHEYSHAALHQIVSLSYSGESGAINEGQADYFACSLSNDPKIGEYVVAKMGKEYLRILTATLHYPEDIAGEVHADGRIWGSVLWDLRITLGASVADKIIHNSFYSLKSGSPKFRDGFNALITADNSLFGGANKDKITEVFKNRGITKSAYNGAVLDAKDLKYIMTFRSVHGE